MAFQPLHLLAITVGTNVSLQASRGLEIMQVLLYYSTWTASAGQES
jgi:hypothetical protein